MTLRNVALVAHVDHGKTTLVDGLLRSTGVFAAHQALVERVMDSNDQERERGITILAKAASIMWRGVKINLVDTPGHADFGGEVERALAMVDGVLLLVDAAEGPLPQTRYVLSKALARDLPAVVVLNKLDRPDARPDEVLSEIEQLFIDLASHPQQLEFPVISAVSRDARAVVGVGLPSEDADLAPVLDAVLDHIPAPGGDPDAPLQALVTNLDASDYLGRLAVGRVVQGTLRSGELVALLSEEYEQGQPAIVRRPSQVLAFAGISRADAEVVRAGDLFVIAGYPEVEIGDTFASPSDPKALPRLVVDEPVLAMTFSINTSPLAGRSGRFMTSRHLRERLEREVRGNVSIRLEDTDSPDARRGGGTGGAAASGAHRVHAPGGLRAAGEQARGDHEGSRRPPARAVGAGTCDVPDAHVGTVTQALAPRRGVVTELRPGDPGRTIITFEAPARGLIGFRSLLLTATRGTALLHQHHAGWTPWAGELPHRTGGAMIADRLGDVTGYALDNLQLRGQLFVGPGDVCYEGMVIGEASRSGDMVVNVVRAKEKTNIRTHSHDDAVKLAAPIEHTLESAIEWIGEDELVEVTPGAIRIRKRLLFEADRRRAAKRT